MSKLEDLIPPLELCKRIPEGAFADSALVYYRDMQYEGSVDVMPRFFCVPERCIPAPTLEEIMADMFPASVWCLGNEWTCCQVNDSLEHAIDGDRAVCVALQMWFRVRWIETKEDQSCRG